MVSQNVAQIIQSPLVLKIECFDSLYFDDPLREHRRHYPNIL